MFVQRLCSDLALAVGPFMLNSLQEAIERARICKIIYSQGLVVYGSATIYNRVASTVASSQLYQTIPPSVQSSVSNPAKQIVTLLQEVVFAVRNNNNNNNNQPHPP